MNLPSEWVIVRLKDIILDTQPGFAQRPGDDAGSTPQIRTHNVSPGGYIDLAGIKYVTPSEKELERYSLNPQDVIFNNTNSEEWVGKTALFKLEEVYVFSNHMTRIRVNSQFVEPEYVARYLHFLWQSGYSRQRAKRWVSQAAIDQSTLLEFKIALPTLPEQQRIVAILRQADELRCMQRETLEQTQKLPLALFIEMFGDPISNSKQLLSDVQTLREDELVLTLRVLLEVFYEIALRNGLPLNAWGDPSQSFDRSRFVDMFKEENYGRVYPLCDGDMNGPEVDHWLPKSKYPALSCHPKNLVPVCHRCNSRECKGEKSPLDIGVPRPFDDWFHPYERPAHGNFSVSVNGSRVSLMHGDLVQQRRLDNFDGLVKLTPRWSEEYKSQTASYLKQLRDKVRRKRIKPAPDGVLDTINEWLAEVAAEGTRMPHSIIRRTVLEQVNTMESPNFHAWLKEAEEALA